MSSLVADLVSVLSSPPPTGLWAFLISSAHRGLWLHMRNRVAVFRALPPTRPSEQVLHRTSPNRWTAKTDALPALSQQHVPRCRGSSCSKSGTRRSCACLGSVAGSISGFYSIFLLPALRFDSLKYFRVFISLKAVNYKSAKSTCLSVTFIGYCLTHCLLLVWTKKGSTFLWFCLRGFGLFF